MIYNQLSGLSYNFDTTVQGFGLGLQGEGMLDEDFHLTITYFRTLMTDGNYHLYLSGAGFDQTGAILEPFVSIFEISSGNKIFPWLDGFIGYRTIKERGALSPDEINDSGNVVTTRGVFVGIAINLF
mgnify:CR=1 FL=1